MVSLKILLLPIMVAILSGVIRVDENRPISFTLPVIPQAVMKSPTLKGRKTIKKTPAAKLDSSPAQAAPIAMPAVAIKAAKLVVCIPK